MVTVSHVKVLAMLKNMLNHIPSEIRIATRIVYQFKTKAGKAFTNYHDPNRSFSPLAALWLVD